MKVLHCVDVNDAYFQGLSLLRREGIASSSRAGDVLVYPTPVTTAYNMPTQRVLFDAKRDANPFFHLMESLWMLAGRRDATWLDQFVSDFSSRYAEVGGLMHGAYGWRWRNAFGMDQIGDCITLLKRNPDDRRVVIQMWDADTDLGADKKDVPCNLIALPRIHSSRLDLTVFCRSNDAVWGAYGANAVHFSILQEYLASMIGVSVGVYYQVSNNFHVYTNVLDKVTDPNWSQYPAPDLYRNGVKPDPLVTNPLMFIHDLRTFMNGTSTDDTYYNVFFNRVAVPMMNAHKAWKAGDHEKARSILDSAPDQKVDWILASKLWLERRIQRKFGNGGQVIPPTAEGGPVTI